MTDDTTQLTHRAQALSYALSLLTDGGAREGRDATGVVAVRLTASGATESIELSDGWQLRLPADKVAAAVTDAARAARRDAFTDAMRAISELPDSIDDVVVPAGFTPPAPPRPMSSDALLNTPPDLDGLNASLDHAQGLVDAVTSAGAPRESTLAATPETPVVFRTDAAGAILECAIDPTWLKGVRASALSDELWTAFTTHRGGH